MILDIYTKYCSGAKGIASKDNAIVAYVSPKCGLTSIKYLTALTYEPVVTQDFVSLDYLKGRAEYRMSRDAAGTKLAVIRDPVSRFVSGYKHVVLNNNDLAPIMDTPPTFDEFVANFDSYNAQLKALDSTAPNIQIEFHFSPQVNCVGSDPTKFDYVYDLEADTDAIFALYDAQYGKTFPRVHLNSTDNGQPITPTQAQVDWIKAKYADDYAVWFSNK